MKEKRYIKYLEQNSWYHGTTLQQCENILQKGIIYNYNEGTELDFGYGFYLTPKFKQAEHYITRMLPYIPGEEEKTPVVIEFEFNCSAYIETNPNTKFLKYDEEFARFVLENRKNPDSLTHEFDFVIGVMSDSNPVGELIKLRNGELSEEDVILSFMKGTSMEQLSLHTQDLCDKLIVKKVTFVTDGKELDINDIKKSNYSK